MEGLEKVMKYAGVFMVVLYLMIGVSILLNPNGLFEIPEKYAVPAGILLILYAIFRAYRLYQKHFTNGL